MARADADALKHFKEAVRRYTDEELDIAQAFETKKGRNEYIDVVVEERVRRAFDSPAARVGRLFMEAVALSLKESK